MDAIELLTSQHHTVEALMKTVLEDADPGLRRQRLQQAANALTLHLVAEESVFYPALQAGRIGGQLLGALEEHLSLKRLLADLLLQWTGAPGFEAKLRMLRSELEHHHLEDETQLFPLARRLIDGPRRSELGLRMEQLQVQLLRQGLLPPVVDTVSWADATDPAATVAAAVGARPLPVS
ncbi:MAG: hemerythrin domain-containing protein [Burkholderiales bacterium]